VQIALLSARITILTDHLKENKKDHSSKLGMLKLVGQRRRLMKYLKKNDLTRYTSVISELNIRDIKD
jgi:small subunit ribosomal protein S15